MDSREERGLQIAQTNRIVKGKDGYLVPSQTGKGAWTVNLNGTPRCTCPDFTDACMKCKHIFAVEFSIRRKQNPDGTVTETKTMKVTYAQEWHEYNEAQTHEHERFLPLLKELCAGIPQPEYQFGRPRLPLADVTFTAISRMYSTLSARRFTSDLVEIGHKGLVSKTPSFNSGLRYLDNPELTPILKSLVEQSALPLASIEQDFAADSTGFATSVYRRWYDHKYGKERLKGTWVKTHIMTGVKTHIVTAVEATPTESSDALKFEPILLDTVKNFNVQEVSADKAYSSRKNLDLVNMVGAKPFIMFNANANGIGNKADGFNAFWNRMYHFYSFNKNEFYTHYGKRSNAETTFSMVKAKFGARVRAKKPTAQVNEVLCKIVAHNICVLIQSIYELKLEPVFWQADCTNSNQLAPKLSGF